METVKQEAWNTPSPQFQNNKKIACGIFALLLGPLGVHKFYLGYTGTGNTLANLKYLLLRGINWFIWFNRRDYLPD